MQHKKIKSLDFIQIKLNQMAKVNDILNICCRCYLDLNNLDVPPFLKERFM